MNPDPLSLIQTCLTAVNATAIFVAAWQLRMTKRQAITTFEDTIAREYRDLANDLPIEAILGEELPKDLSEKEGRAAFEVFCHYFDLCNEQVFLREIGRVSDKTWKFWCDGISSNLKRPAFLRAWGEFSRRSKDFQELRRLIESDYAEDPKRPWSPRKWAKHGGRGTAPGATPVAPLPSQPTPAPLSAGAPAIPTVDSGE